MICGPPAVSVIVPTWNREKLLSISVESVRQQTFRDWELLIIDDFSTDGTRALVDSWSVSDDRIRWIQNRRTKGPAGARNTGMDEARGRYIAFLDSDDEWTPQHLERAVQYLDRYPSRIDLVTANAIRRDRETGAVYQQQQLDLNGLRHEMVERAYVLNAEDVFDSTLDHPVMTTQTIVVKRDVAACIVFAEDLPPGPEDILFQLELANAGVCIAHLAEFHLTYWAHGDNLTACGGKHSPEKIISLFQAYQPYYERLLSQFRLTPRQRARIINLMAQEAFWQVGYNGYMQLGQGDQARAWFWKALRLQPLQLSFWKTFVASYVADAARLLAAHTGRPAAKR